MADPTKDEDQFDRVAPLHRLVTQAIADHLSQSRARNAPATNYELQIATRAVRAVLAAPPEVLAAALRGRYMPAAYERVTISDAPCGLIVLPARKVEK